MEENTNQITTQTNATNVQATENSKKSNNNVFMLLIILALFITFAILIFAINRNIEADYLSVIKPADILNPPRVVNRSLPQEQVGGTDSIEVGDVDTELQGLDSDLEGL